MVNKERKTLEKREKIQDTENEIREKQWYSEKQTLEIYLQPHCKTVKVSNIKSHCRIRGAQKAWQPFQSAWSTFIFLSWTNTSWISENWVITKK